MGGDGQRRAWRAGPARKKKGQQLGRAAPVGQVQPGADRQRRPPVPRDQQGEPAPPGQGREVCPHRCWRPARQHPGAARQPILLTTNDENLNGADALFLVDGAEPGELGDYTRCVVLFDGGDEEALATARRQWRAVKAKGLPASYWKQQGRGWEKQA